ncbi:MAG: hypothetical protein AAB525_02295 [Patescibacteria group bacterium]
MQNDIITQNLKEIDKKAKDAGVREGKDSEVEIVAKMYEKDKIEASVQKSEALGEELHKTASVAQAQKAGTVSPSATFSPLAKSEFLLQVENVLAQDLGDIYEKLEPNLKLRFKNKGEEIAHKIEMVISEGKAKIKQIVLWIKQWLKIIPGVNRFFLEQEAKIKADKIISMA